MDDGESQIVGAVASKYQQKDLRSCVNDARAVRGTIMDLKNLGWVYYYEYKCLYELARYKEAFDLFNEITGPKQSAIVFTPNNGHWMYSVALELAYRLKDRQAVNDIADKAVALAKDEPDRIKQIEANRKAALEGLK